MQCCTILRAFKKGCLLKMGCYSENNSDNFKDLCWPNYLSVTVLLIKLKLQNADSLFECPFRFIIKHRPTSRACLVSTLVRAEGWHSGGILSLSYAAGARPAVSSDHGRYLTSHMRGAGPTIAHMGTLMMHWQRPPHPSHRSCSVQFILMLIHAIDCGVEPGHAAAGVLHMFQSVSGCRVFLPLPSPLCPDPASSELISNFTIFATVLPISLSAPR